MQGKNIVFVIPDLKGNGAERVVTTLAAEFELRGATTHIVVFKAFSEILSIASSVVHEFPMRYFRWLPRSVRGAFVSPLLDRFILKKCGTPDLVLSNLLPADRVMCRSGLPNVHLIVHNTISKELLDQTDPIRRQRMFNTLEGIYRRRPVVCVSKGVEKDFIALFPGHEGVRQIYNPVDVRLIKMMAAEPAPIDGSYIVNVGKFKHAKRQDLLIRAYARSGLTIPLVLVGQGGLRADLEVLAAELGVSERVIFPGFQKNPYPWIANATMMVHTADYEGLGMVLLEALVLGVPTISTDCKSGPREILPAGNLVPVGDIDALVEKISTVWDCPKAFVVPIKDDFLPDAVVGQFAALLT